MENHVSTSPVSKENNKAQIQEYIDPRLHNAQFNMARLEDFSGEVPFPLVQKSVWPSGSRQLSV